MRGERKGLPSRDFGQQIVKASFISVLPNRNDNVAA